MNDVIVRGAAFLFAGYVGLAIGLSAIAADDLHKFGVGGTATLCVPSSDLDPMLIPYDDESTDLAVGSGHIPGFAFLFDAKTVQSTMSSGTFEVFPNLNFMPNVNRLGGSIGFLSKPDFLRLGSGMRARDLSDEWYQTGRCTHEKVSAMGQSGVFEVKCAAGDYYFNVLNVAPNRDHPMPDLNAITIASCNYEYIPAGPFKGITLHFCRRVVTQPGFILDYRIQKENVPLYKQIDSFLDSRIRAWKRNCAHQS